MGIYGQGLNLLLMFGWQEGLIILAIVVIIFGGARLAGVGKASGRAIREFKEELKGDEPTVANQAAAAEPTASSADGTPNPTPLGNTDLR